MTIGLIYATKSGHSRKIAGAIASELQIEALDIRTKPQLDGIDLLYIVGGIYGGKSAPELVEFVRTITPQQVKRAALLTSSAGKVATQKDVRETLVANGVDVIADEFTCQGSMLVVGMGHPNAEDVRNAVAFARRTSATA